MKNIILIIILFFIFLNTTFSQSKIKVGKTCSYNGLKIPEFVYTFSSDKDADDALTLILNASGLSKNFKLLAGDVPNACATITINPKTNQIERYIIYNQTFMNNISKHNNYWASISILAHEIGHHLNGHSLLTGGSRPNLELEADKFSGFILSKLGATLDEAQTAVNTLPEAGSLTHPPRSARQAAVANGWYENNKVSENNRNTTTNKTILTRPIEIFCGNDPNIREEVFLIKTGKNKFKLVSEKGFEFTNSDYKTIEISKDIIVFWFPHYIAYGYIDNFEEIELSKPQQLRLGNCSNFEKNILGNLLYVFFPDKSFYTIYDGDVVVPKYTYTETSNLTQEAREVLGKNKLVYEYYEINDGLKNVKIGIDQDYIKEAYYKNKIIVKMGWVEKNK